MNRPIIAMPRRLLDMNNIFSTALDMLFDPFDEFDQEICHDILWLRKPELSQKKKKPNVPSKYRLNIDVRGYKHDSLKTEIKDEKLVVSGYDETKHEDDFSRKEFSTSFKLPANIDAEKMASFVTKKGHMVIEIPYKRDDETKEEPKIETNADGSGRIVYTMDIKGVDLKGLQVALKDYDVVINYEEVLPFKDDSSTKITNIKIFKLPENVDLQSLCCTCDKEVLKIEAVLQPEQKNVKKVPIYFTEEKPHSESEHTQKEAHEATPVL